MQFGLPSTTSSAQARTKEAIKYRYICVKDPTKFSSHHILGGMTIIKLTHPLVCVISLDYALRFMDPLETRQLRSQNHASQKQNNDKPQWVLTGILG